jgi:hypothetical protein
MVAVFWDVLPCSLVHVYISEDLAVSILIVDVVTCTACVQTLYDLYKTQCLIQRDQIKLCVIISSHATNHTFKRNVTLSQN